MSLQKQINLHNQDQKVLNDLREGDPDTQYSVADPGDRDTTITVVTDNKDRIVIDRATEKVTRIEKI